MLTNVFTGKKVLFQGDSITDCDRDRRTNDLGPGYPAKGGRSLPLPESGKRRGIQSTGEYRETVPAICWHGTRRIFLP